MRKKWIVLAPLALIGFTLFIALGGLIVQWLWNWLLPPLFGWGHVTFWQALGLLALCRILFGGVGGRGGHRSGSRMSPEARECFRGRIRERFGFGPSAGEIQGQ